MEKKPILSAKDVEITFSLRGNKLNAIRKCSLDLYDGETLAIVGESGSGKSTTAYNVIGMEEMTGGKIIFKGRDISMPLSKRTLDMKKEIQIVFQDPGTSLNLSIRYMIFLHCH